MHRSDDEKDEKGAKGANDGSEMPSVTTVTTVIVAIAAVYQVYQLVSWYLNRDTPSVNAQQLARAGFPIPPVLARAMRFLRPADLQKLLPSRSTSLGMPEFSVSNLSVVVSSVISKKAAVFFKKSDDEDSRAESVEASKARFERLEASVAALKECSIRQGNQIEEISKKIGKGIVRDRELLERFIKDRKVVEQENQEVEELSRETDELCRRVEKVEKRFHKIWKKQDEELKYFNDIRNDPEKMKRANALLWILRARAKFIGNLAEFFKGKLNDLPEDVKEAAGQLIEYNKRFRAEIPPNPIDEILSNYYSEEELESYQCPITLAVMMEPVKIVDGEGHECHFERLALQRYYDTVTWDDIGDYSVPTRPDLPLIGRPESYPIDEKMQSGIRRLLERIIDEKPEVDEKTRSRIEGLLKEMKEKSELAKAVDRFDIDVVMESPRTYVRQYEASNTEIGESSSLSTSFSSPSLF